MRNTRLRNKVLFSIPAIVVCILFGCQKKDTLLLTEMQEVTEQETVSDESADTEEVAESEKEVSLSADDVFEPASDVEIPKIMIHICGAVNHPGVYEFEEGDRICQAIEKAGGFTSEADEDLLNQAQKLADGMQLVIPTKEEADKARTEGSGAQEYLRYEETVSGTDSTDGNGLININTATEEMLCTLPGIGSEKAKSIIAYRAKNGNYKKIEDIMNVAGIKTGMFDKIKDKIIV